MNVSGNLHQLTCDVIDYVNNVLCAWVFEGLRIHLDGSPVTCICLQVRRPEAAGPERRVREEYRRAEGAPAGERAPRNDAAGAPRPACSCGGHHGRCWPSHRGAGVQVRILLITPLQSDV